MTSRILSLYSHFFILTPDGSGADGCAVDKVLQLKNLSKVVSSIQEIISLHNINPLNTNGRQFYLKTQFVPLRKHFSSLL